jgi:hypothetical protein
MHSLSSLIIVFGFVFVVGLSLVKLTWDLSQVSVHDSPAIPETPGKPASTEEPRTKAIESYESSPAELSDAQ